MKKAIFLIVVLAMALATAVYAGGGQVRNQYGGLQVDMNITGPGEGTFAISGTNGLGTIDVNGAFSCTIDEETGERTLTVLFGENSVITTADGSTIDLSGQAFSYSGQPAPGKVIFNVIEYIKAQLES